MKSSEVKFELVKELVAELLEDQVSVVIIGYEHCPFSKIALDAAKLIKAKVAFIQITRESADNVKTKLKYQGTFPIVFWKRNGYWQHIGGGTEFKHAVEAMEEQYR